MDKDALEKLAPVAFLCSSGEPVEKLVSLSKSLSSKSDFILITGDTPGIRKGLAAAYINSVLRHNDSSMRASSIQLEMMLLLAGTMRISEAISSVGAKYRGRLLVFATKRGLFERFSRQARLKVKRGVPVRIDRGSAGETAMAELLGGR